MSSPEPDPQSPAKAPPFRPPKPVGRTPVRHSPRLGDMSVAMLTSLMQDTLDPGYREAADRRHRESHSPNRTSSANGRSSALILVTVGVLIAGLIFGVAFKNDTRSEPDKSRAHDALVKQISASKNVAASLSKQATDLRLAVTTARNTLLTQSSQGSALLSEVTDLEYDSAQVAVGGPGIRVTIGDPPAADGGDPVGGQAEPGLAEALIQDRDLQKVINALWNAGAEAIAINGQRLGPTTAIRQAGGAILVDFLPVSSPYLIEAIGPYDELAVGLAGSAIGRKLTTYRNVYQAELDIAQSSDLRLKAALATSVVYAVPQGTEGDN